MGIGGYATVDALRGEMGASLVGSRVMETVLLYALDTMQGSFDNIKDMMEDTMNVKKGRWYNNVSKYMEALGIQWDSLKKMPRKELKARVREYDTKKWEQGLLSKKTQENYVLGKQKMGYDMCYRNTYDSTFFAKARLNALKLEDQIGRGKSNYDKTCKLCGRTKEDMIHFIIDCPALEADRNYELIDSRKSNSQEKMIDLLFNTSSPREVGGMIRKMWHRRRRMLAFIKKRKEMNLPPSGTGGVKHKHKDKNNPKLSTLKSDPGPVRKDPVPCLGRSL